MIRIESAMNGGWFLETVILSADASKRAARLTRLRGWLSFRLWLRLSGPRHHASILVRWRVTV